MRIYLDNAATTPLAPEVLEVMMPYFKDVFGNASSIHMFGREAKTAIERSRRTIAERIGAAPAEVFFTSSGTEANNTILLGAIRHHAIKHVITSPIEHHAVLHPLEYAAKRGEITLHLLSVNSKGEIDVNELEQLLTLYPDSLVSLMYGNNEIGNLNPVVQISQLCKTYHALFHCDTVQAFGHYRLNMQEWDVDFISASAHKFHGPKGVGIMYVRSGISLDPYLYGGAQERNMRAGTENVAGIVGTAKAFELAMENVDAHHLHIAALKERLAIGLETHFPNIAFNGTSRVADQSLSHVLNASFPPNKADDMLSFMLDIKQIATSAGSACSSGTQIGSHVLRSIQVPEDRISVRFSFSRYNTLDEIDEVLMVLNEVLHA